jgi:hypothetical protein
LTAVFTHGQGLLLCGPNDFEVSCVGIPVFQVETKSAELFLDLCDPTIPSHAYECGTQLVQEWKPALPYVVVAGWIGLFRVA